MPKARDFNVVLMHIKSFAAPTRTYKFYAAHPWFERDKNI